MRRTDHQRQKVHPRQQQKKKKKQKNFASVAEMDEFSNLEAKEVERWILNDQTSVSFKADMFKIVLKWIELN